MSRHAHVADPDPPTGIIDVSDKRFQHCARQLLSLVAFRLQARDDQHHVQNDHLEAAVHRIGHAIVAVEGLGARLCHNCLVEAEAGAALRRACRKARQLGPE